MIVGGLLGSLVGFVRGRTENVIMSLIDVILAFPALILLLALVSIFEVRSLALISIVIGVLSIPAYTRVSRAISLAISQREFVLAARAIGTKPRTILFREIIPNVLPTVLAYALVAAAFVVVVEGSLSFLGLSVQLPQSTWGNMINQARRDIRLNIAQVFWPSLALSLTVLALNQVGDFFQRRSAVGRTIIATSGLAPGRVPCRQGRVHDRGLADVPLLPRPTPARRRADGTPNRADPGQPARQQRPPYRGPLLLVLRQLCPVPSRGDRLGTVGPAPWMAQSYARSAGTATSLARGTPSGSGVRTEAASIRPRSSS